jgi:hypothetical protein
VENSPNRATSLMYPVIWTVGHSTRALEVFIAILQQNDVQWIADVRSNQ